MIILQNTNKETRAVVLGGGGVTGMAWEIGIIPSVKEDVAENGHNKPSTITKPYLRSN